MKTCALIAVMAAMLSRVLMVCLFLAIPGCGNPQPSTASRKNAGSPALSNDPDSLANNQQPPTRDAGQVARTVPSLAGYESWDILSPGGHQTSEWISGACGPLPVIIVSVARKQDGPHALRLINVHANSHARTAVGKRSKSPLPAGSVLVKVKHVSTSNIPKEIAAMVKREAGYDPTGGDWEYVFVDATGKLDRGKIATCKDCHSGRVSHDYLFLPYLNQTSNEASEPKLKSN